MARGVSHCALPWFRLYGETVDDAKLRLLAFEDRWHYIAILCCKAQGIIDGTKLEMLDRMIAAKLGLAARELDEVRRRLKEVALINHDWQPLGWERRQYVSDTSVARTRKWREKLKTKSEEQDKNKTDTEGDVTGDVTVTLRPSRRVPESFSPDEAFALAALPDLDIKTEVAKFRDCEFAKPRKDWPATWRTWIRNCKDSGRYSRRSNAKTDPYARAI
jgi:hypothetical protein